MIDATRYSIVVRRVDIDGSLIWRASVKELPDIAEYGDDAHSAYDAALEAIGDLCAVAQEDGRQFPEPEGEGEEYSGRITLRMPPSLHAKSAGFADREDTSLNQYICMILAATVGAAGRPEDVWPLSATWVASCSISAAAEVRGQVDTSAFQMHSIVFSDVPDENMTISAVNTIGGTWAGADLEMPFLKNVLPLRASSVRRRKMA
jgi:predicted HicB family RNase H-like nuclease